jgi:hypothetical protein
MVHPHWILDISVSSTHYNPRLDCFIRFGAYEVCVNTSYLSVYSNLFLLMAQALISRVIHTRHEQLCERVGAEFYVFHSFGTT